MASRASSTGGGQELEAAAWLTLDDAVRGGLIAPGMVEHVREVEPGLLVQLLEHAGGGAAPGRDDELADRLYRIAVSLGSQNPGCRYNLGNIAARLGRGAEAIQWYTAAIEQDPTLAVAHFNRGVEHRKRGEEGAAQADMSMAIQLGYGRIEAYAAWVRPRRHELGPPAEALAEAADVVRLSLAGEPEVALAAAAGNLRERRKQAGRSFRDRVALVVALESQCDLLQQLGATSEVVPVAEELVDLCRTLAEVATWEVRDEPLRWFVVGELPRRLVDLTHLYTKVGRHDDALAAAGEALRRCGGPAAAHPQYGRAYAVLAEAVYSEMRRRATT